MKQRQFLEVLDRDEAERRWRAVIDVAPLAAERVPLAEALGRVLAAGRATPRSTSPASTARTWTASRVRAADTFGASEAAPVRLALGAETIPTGVAPASASCASARRSRSPPAACCRAAPTPWSPSRTRTSRAASVIVRRAVVPGAAVSFAGTDIGSGETRAVRRARVSARARRACSPRSDATRSAWCAGRASRSSRPATRSCSRASRMRPGLVYDSNGRILADAVRELGGEPDFLGAFRDDEAALRAALAQRARERRRRAALRRHLEGRGRPLRSRVVAELEPGIVVHGVALKPGKPICLAAAGRSPVVILPGFPTSAIFTFHEFVAPVIRALAGAPARGARERARDAWRSAPSPSAGASSTCWSAWCAARTAGSPPTRWARAAAA